MPQQSVEVGEAARALEQGSWDGTPGDRTWRMTRMAGMRSATQRLGEKRRRRAARWLLAWIAGLSLATGLYAAVAPRSFYVNIVGVDLLGPYNEHLLGDVGGFYLGFGVLFAWAAVSLGRDLVRAACAAAAVTQLLHFAYHAAHLDGFGADEAIAQTLGLAIYLLLPIVAGVLVPASRTA